jgi:hypothetical protein
MKPTRNKALLEEQGQCACASVRKTAGHKDTASIFTKINPRDKAKSQIKSVSVMAGLVPAG